MPPLNIKSISQGMDLQNADFEIGEGFTKESVGLDYGTPGIVKPMRAASTINTFPASKQDEQIVYLGAYKYLFTTTSAGLYVTDITSGIPVDHTSSTLINNSFTGTFKALPVNDQYVILANATSMRKWARGMSTTYQLGLNTPPTPTLALGTALTKTIDVMDSATGWTIKSGTGGGPSYAAVAADTSVKNEGTASIRFSLRRRSTLTVSKDFHSTPIDLSKFTTTGDLGIAFIYFSFFIDTPTDLSSIELTFSCASDGAFDKDAYSCTISPGAIAQASPTDESTNEDIYGQTATGAYDPESGRVMVYKLPYDSISGSAGPVEEYTYIVAGARRGRTVTVTGSWITCKIQVGEFGRIGVSSGRDWSTITGIRIVATSNRMASVLAIDFWVDNIYMIGGGNLWGTYYVAAAYQNAYGNYGPYSAFAGPIAVQGVPLTIGNLTADTDAQTTKRRLAIIGGSLTTPMVYLLSDNTSTSITYNSEDIDLLTEESRWNNQKAPAGCRDIINFQGRIWLVGVPGYKNRIVYSEQFFYEAFPYVNYRILGEAGEDLYQVASVGDYVAARGSGKEYLTYPVGDGPLFWRTLDGAPEGAVSSRFLVKWNDSEHVYASRNGFYKSGAGADYVLQQINPVVSDFTAVRGVRAGKFIYIAFQDTGGTNRLMRIDMRLFGKIIPHYVANVNPVALYADPITKAVYYTVGAVTYQVDAASGPLATKLVIPGQFGIRAMGWWDTDLKEFSEIYYKLSGGPLTLTLVRDGTSDSTTISLANNTEEVVSLPQNSVRSMGMILESTTQDFVLTLPMVSEVDRVG